MGRVAHDLTSSDDLSLSLVDGCRLDREKLFEKGGIRK
jgi:hypothetical protein